MTRRTFFATAAAVSALPVAVPVHRIVDKAVQLPQDQLARFWSVIWPEAFSEFQRASILLQTTDGSGEVRRTAGDRPVLIGLRPKAINLILTDHIPPYWDDGRALAGVSAIYEGHSFCMLALRYAHPNRVPFLSVNTCVHELLHVLLRDVYLSRPKAYQTAAREFRIDSTATRLWLSQGGSNIRQSAQIYVESLR